MRRGSRSIELRKLMPFTDRASNSRKYRTSDSIHSDEDPLIDEELGVSLALESPYPVLAFTKYSQ